MQRLLVLLFITFVCYSLSVSAVIYQNSTNPPPTCDAYSSNPTSASFITFRTFVQNADKNGNFQNVSAIITASFDSFDGPVINNQGTVATYTVRDPLVSVSFSCPGDGSACPFPDNSSSNVQVTNTTLLVFVTPGTSTTSSFIEFTFNFPLTGDEASYSYAQIVNPPPSLDTFPTCQYLNSVFTDPSTLDYDTSGRGEGSRFGGDSTLVCGATCSTSPSVSLTPSITSTPSTSLSSTPSISISNTPSISQSSTPSTSVSNTPSISISNSPSISVSNTPSISVSNTPSISVSNTPSVSLTSTPSTSATNSPTSGASQSTTPSNIPSLSSTPSTSVTATPSTTTGASQSSTSSISNSPTSSGTSGASISTTPSNSPPPTVSNSPSISPSLALSTSSSTTRSASASPSSSPPSASPQGDLPSFTGTPSPSYTSVPSASPYPVPPCTPTETCCCDARRAEQAQLIADLSDLEATAQRIDSRINSLDEVESQIEALSGVNAQLKRIQNLLNYIQNQ